ncbi:hypothetical protein KIPE111705_39915 [Kibdelosporangium persicum]|uniref:hypothetical protein n=1 Tax=Kibdelosporangium persicum TaxID=2698649 RepID=UPI001566E92F|nr:hypothetical protein [Kibdelosporangium persicum]
MSDQDEFTPITPDPPHSPGTPEPPDLDVDPRAIQRKVEKEHAGDTQEDDTEGEEPPD